MGIVVCVAMLLGLVVLVDTRFKGAQYKGAVNAVITFLALAGLWNMAWYGLQNLDRFWGWAGLISGAFMLFSAILIYCQRTVNGMLLSTQGKLIKNLLVVGLGFSFLLYAVTLVQLNLGLQIIQ